MHTVCEGIVEFMTERSSPDWKPPPQAVLVLTKDNFTEFTTQEELCVVMFYAPWSARFLLVLVLGCIYIDTGTSVCVRVMVNTNLCVFQWQLFTITEVETLAKH